MDGLRMVDEWRTFDPDATREDAVFRQAGSFDAYREAVRGESRGQLADAERLYQLLDGRTPARRAVDRSRVGSFEGARLLTALRRVGASSPSRRRSCRSRRAPTRERPRRAPVGGAPSPPCCPSRRSRSWPGSRSALPAPASIGLAADPLAAARAAGAAQRMRNAAEAFRFAHGRWPRDAAELAADGWTPIRRWRRVSPARTFCSRAATPAARCSRRSTERRVRARP